MTDIRGPDVKKLAEKDYISGMKYKDISEKYNISLNTVKSWKQRYKWDRKGVHTKEKVCIQKENKEKSIQEPIAKEVKEVLENTELTDKQRLFCIIYSRCLNATKAYQRSYQCSYETAMVEGCKSLRNPKIKEQIEKLNAAEFSKEFIKKSVLQKYIDIAFTDITDYVAFGQEEVPVMGAFGPVIDKETNEVITKMVNVVKFKESIEVDGTIISEVSQGKNGASIKLQDKMKALDFLAKHIGLLDVATKEKIQNEKTKIEIAKEKLELEKSKVMGAEDDVGDDGFIEALKGEIAEVWDNE